jgi:hypothetical protein
MSCLGPPHRKTQNQKILILPYIDLYKLVNSLVSSSMQSLSAQIVLSDSSPSLLDFSPLGDTEALVPPE